MDSIFYCPIWFEHDPMKGLILLNITHDPDEIYIGFEPQVFDDEINGKGMLVIAWRKDGFVDVYHDHSLKIRPEKYSIAGKGLHTATIRDFSKAFFDVTPAGAQLSVAFTDAIDRPIRLVVKEQNPTPTRPFDLLAPMGNAAEKPTAMPLVILHDFYFVRRAHTDVLIEISSKKHQADTLPVPMDFQSMYFIRYSPKPLIITLNPAQKGELKALNRINSLDNQLEYRGNIYTLTTGNKAIETIHLGEADTKISMWLDPPMPLITRDINPFQMTGHFGITNRKGLGEITGRYSIKLIDKKVLFEMSPSGGWQPEPDKLSLKFMYAMGKIFKNWPKDYKWMAELDLSQLPATLKSNWQKSPSLS